MGAGRLCSSKELRSLLPFISNSSNKGQNSMADIQFHLFSTNNAALRSPITVSYDDLVTVVVVSDGQPVTFTLTPTYAWSSSGVGIKLVNPTANSVQLKMPSASACVPLQLAATITATSASLGISRDLSVLGG
jgi:hypothetical protein